MINKNTKLSNIHIFCDIDGTLGIAGLGIPSRNKQAINRFVSLGGKFSLCTGRWVSNITSFVEGIPVNAPSVVGNGCGIYDFEARKYLAKKVLPSYTKGYLERVMTDYPELGIMVANDEGYFLLENKNFPMIVNHWKLELRQLSEIKEPYYKFMFITKEDHLQSALKNLEAYKFKGVRLVPSIVNGIEMIPENTNKALAFLEICKNSGTDIKNTVFIGDFYNDKEIFSEAGFSACPSETPDALKAMCDIVLGSCMGGAVADLIEHLESQYAV